jgi:predicted DCC family thiol-disulfide oxidoreductase YuxK
LPPKPATTDLPATLMVVRFGPLQGFAPPLETRRELCYEEGSLTCEASVWAIASDGGRYRGAEAVNALVAAALGTAVPLFVYSLPGIRQLQDIIYSLVASNRSRLPGDHPYCAQHPAECR